MHKIIDIDYDSLGTFSRRVNRFVVEFKTSDGVSGYAHLHDPGRLKELLYEGNYLLLKREDSPKRKTKWDVIAALGKNGDYVLINSKYHRYIADKILEDPLISPIGEIAKIEHEVKIGCSRLDYRIETVNNVDIFVELKGCTLLEGKYALFPDAPTARGKRHIEELISLKRKGIRSALIILVFVDADIFVPNWKRDPEFAEVFSIAVEEKLEIYPIKVTFVNGAIYYNGLIDYAKKSFIIIQFYNYGLYYSWL